LRYRAGEFSAADFALASEVQGEPTPAAAGAAESFTLTGLIAGTSYRFALRTVDEAGNWSDISNVAVGATESAPPPPPPGDTTPPATTSLTLVSAGADTVVLSWVAPGDDTTSGRASLLAMRLDVLPITDDRWAQALVVVGLPQPAAAGTVQRVTVYGLLPSTLYYFAFRARDDAGNWSDVGPSLDVKTQDQPDTSPPLAPAGLNGKSEAGQVDLYWDGSPDPTVVGYHVYRRVGIAAWERLNSALLQATTFTDQHPEPGAHYDYAVTAVDSHGQESPKSVSFTVAIPGETIADLAVVVPPTPNPFRRSMSFSIVVPAARTDNVLAAVFDVQGALVRILHEGPLQAGEQSFTWDGRGANGQPARGGIYFVQLRGGARTLVHKVVLTR
jgi:chitodextrinase